MHFTLTLGPASAEPQVITELLEQSNRFRLNASHLSPESLREWLIKLEAIFRTTGKRIPVVVDLQGAKIRIGSYPSVETTPEIANLVLGEQSTDPALIPVPSNHFFKAIKVGDTIALNDGKVLAKVTSAAGTQATIQITHNGPLSSRKGITRRPQPIAYDSLATSDEKMIATSLDFDFVEYAFSFAFDGQEASVVRPSVGGKRLIGKVERVGAMEKLIALDQTYDELWFCRGDLGAEAGIEKIGVLQTRFTQAMQTFKKPAFLAGQVLEYMTHFPYPTRSEIAHLYEALTRIGFKGAVLSDETAVGRNPLAVGRFLKAFRKSAQLL